MVGHHEVEPARRTSNGLPRYYIAEFKRNRGEPGVYAWLKMIKRCYHPGDRRYRYYGGAGVRVCERWLCSFRAFIEDLGAPPRGYMLSRHDKRGDYEPINCAWALKSVGVGDIGGGRVGRVGRKRGIDRREFRVSDALRCVSGASFTTIRYWSRVGFLRHGVEGRRVGRKGRRKRLIETMTFSLPELAYLRLLVYFSRFGVLSPDTVLVPWFGDRGYIPLTDPGSFLVLLEKYRWGILLAGRIAQCELGVGVVRKDKRTKDYQEYCMIDLHLRRGLGGRLDTWLGSGCVLLIDALHVRGEVEWALGREDVCYGSVEGGEGGYSGAGVSGG